MVVEADKFSFYESKMRLSPLNQKGQVQTIAPAVLALIFAAIVLVFGIIISQSIVDTDVVRKASASSVDNETIAGVDELGVAVASSSFPACSISSLIATNASTGGIIDSGNYTISGCTVTSTGLGAENGSDWNVTYAFTYGEEAYVSGNKSIKGLATFADFWEIIVLAIVITVVIGLLLVVFGGRRSR